MTSTTNQIWQLLVLAGLDMSNAIDTPRYGAAVEKFNALEFEYRQRFQESKNLKNLSVSGVTESAGETYTNTQDSQERMPLDSRGGQNFLKTDHEININRLARKFDGEFLGV